MYKTNFGPEESEDCRAHNKNKRVNDEKYIKNY
jgi:hypothetical protein